MRVRRIDFASTLAAPVRRADGTMIVEARIARTGVQSYRNADGSVRREYRSPAEVFKTDSLSTFRGVPLTNEHPPTMLTANNARQYAVGAVLDAPRRDGDYAIASVAVFDAATVAAMEAGKNQVSCGYDVDLVETPGTAPDGQHFDAVQTNIVGNHLAIVGSARAGKDAAVRMDAAYEDAELNAAARNQIPAREFAAGDKLPIENEAHVRDAMSRFSQTHFASDAEKRTAYHKILAAAHKFGIDATGFEAAHRMDAQEFDMDKDEQIRALKLRCDEADKTMSERKDALDSATLERDQLRGKVATLETQVATLTAQAAAGATAMETEAIKTQATRADAAETKLAQLESTREAEIRRATEIRLKARAVMGSDFKTDGMPDRVVQCAVIKKFAPKEDVGDQVSGAYIASRFDSLVEAFTANARSLTRISEVLMPGPTGAHSNTREARAKAWHEQAINGGYKPATK